jgi:outer membrane protein assembly factor BamB
LNATSGKIAWHAETSYWLSSSPSLVNDVVFLECAGHGGTICAFDASTGADLWDSPDSGSSSSDPPTVTGGMVYEICNYNNVCVYSTPSQ